MKKKFLIIAATVLVAVAVVFTLISQISLREELKSRDEIISRFMDQTMKDLGFLNESQELMKQNTSQVRQYLKLPVLNFPERSVEKPDEYDTVEVSSFELAAYDAASYLNDYNIKFNQIRWFNDFFNNPEFSDSLKENTLFLKKKSDLKKEMSDRDGTIFFNIDFDDKLNQVIINPGLSNEKRSFGSIDKSFLDFIRTETVRQRDIYRTVRDYNTQLAGIYRNRELKTLIQDKNLYWGKSAYRNENLYIPLMRMDGTTLAFLTTVSENTGFLFNQQNYADMESLTAGLKKFLEISDLRTSAEILDDQVLGEMDKLMADPAFNAHLNKLGYSLNKGNREDNDYIYYDLYNEKGELAGAYALQKEFGEVYLMDKDDIPVRSLRTFAPNHEMTYSFQKEEIPEERESEFQVAAGSETFLMIGSHEHNADTMILVHCDSITEEIKMLSIPRDLYYNGLKINSIYRNYGPERLVSELSSITGLNISKYVAIDMYAFIDVINLLGGIDVELDEPLIDPTYKVRENGKWSTLYYTAGEHHLDGIAALRITRSRHTSSDFERAVRQQKVIAALRDSLSSMDLTDITRIYDFMQIAGKYLDTNLNTSEMVRYFMGYKDYNINGQNVLNTDNILYATYTNLYRLTKEEQKKALEDPDFYKGGWIVLPKNNDWSQIKMFIQSIMTSS